VTIYELEAKLRQDAKDRGAANGQLWHEADIDGYHLYISDSSFGDGPYFSIRGNGVGHSFENPMGEWVPTTLQTTMDDLDWIMDLAKLADWTYRLEKLQKF
jgi:hypothetical protein